MITDEKFEKTMRIILNFSMLTVEIMMASFGQAFSGLAGAFSRGFGEAMVEKSGQKGKKAATAKVEIKKSSQEVQQKIRVELKNISQEIIRKLNEAWPKIEAHKLQLKSYLTDKFCDEGISIINKYGFKLPKLYEKLSEEDVNAYINLALIKDDAKFAKVMKEIADWVEKMPPEGSELLGIEKEKNEEREPDTKKKIEKVKKNGFKFKATTTENYTDK